MKKFLERLNACKGDMSVSAFARFLEINQKTLDMYMKGQRKPSVELVVTVCTKCNRSADWLLGLASNCTENSQERTNWKARAIFSEKKLERVNRALGHALKGFEELQEAVK